MVLSTSQARDVCLPAWHEQLGTTSKPLNLRASDSAIRNGAFAASILSGNGHCPSLRSTWHENRTLVGVLRVVELDLAARSQRVDCSRETQDETAASSGAGDSHRALETCRRSNWAIVSRGLRARDAFIVNLKCSGGNDTARTGTA